jgi:hypothetical protein
LLPLRKFNAHISNCTYRHSNPPCIGQNCRQWGGAIPLAFDFGDGLREWARMRPRLQRLSLIDQLCAALRDGLARGDWPDWLPSERQIHHPPEERQRQHRGVRLRRLRAPAAMNLKQA